MLKFITAVHCSHEERKEVAIPTKNYMNSVGMKPKYLCHDQTTFSNEMASHYP